MLMMTEVTAKWMDLMIERGFPPLTPHHTQALTVLMMSRFYTEHLAPAESRARASGARASEKEGWGGLLGGAPPKLQSFIAQVATGEGKSIVIAMLAVFMVWTS
jgi:hypothetical protein